MPINEVENLVFSGGGVKVIAYAGVIKALEEKGHLSNIHKVAGASGGAITALCVALGYNSTEIEEILKTIDFNKFADPIDSQHDLSGGLQWCIDHLPNWLSGLKSIVPYVAYLNPVSQLIDTYGIHPGEAVQVFLEELVTKKGFNKDITFKELNDHTDKELYVIATNLNTQFPEVLSHTSDPDKKVVECVRASGAFPLYFKPVTIDSTIYVDGGVMDNYPISVFDGKNIKQQFNTKTTQDPLYNKTLGFKPINKEILEAFEHGVEPKPFVKIENIEDHGIALAEAISSSDAIDALNNHDRTVFIDDHGISALLFNITPEQRQELIDSGYQATNDFMARSNENDIVQCLGDDYMMSA